jgi:hypothetical protein
MCPLCLTRCDRETLRDGYLCALTGFAYALDDAGEIRLVEETHQSLAKSPLLGSRSKPIRAGTWNIRSAARITSG